MICNAIIILRLCTYIHKCLKKSYDALIKDDVIIKSVVFLSRLDCQDHTHTPTAQGGGTWHILKKLKLGTLIL